MSARKTYSCSLCGGAHHDRRTCGGRLAAHDVEPARRQTYALAVIGKALNELDADERARVIAAINTLYGDAAPGELDDVG